MKTLVVGASTNPSRYSYRAAHSLADAGEEIVLFGRTPGIVAGQEITTTYPADRDIDTVTLYVSAKHQASLYDAILETTVPRRLIFNPGTENPELEALATRKGIEVERACTLVLLATKSYRTTE